MLSYEEKQKLEQEFQYALDNIVSKIKGETATAIVYSEQSMILLFRKLIFKIEKQSKEIEELKETLKCTQNSWYEDTKIIDKIKAKIEECEKEKNIPHEMDFKAFYRIEDLKNIEIAVLQSLLEKE